jgi:hypothetical protein
MKKVVSAAKSRWRRFSRVAQITIVTLVLLLVGIRLAMPYAIKRYVNHKLDQLPEYDGRVADIDVHLIRGAYTIDGVEIVKTGGDVPVPFFAARKVDFSIQWRELFHRAIVGEVFVERGKVNFVKGPTKEQSQTSVDSSWIGIVKDLFPFKINRFEFNDSELRFSDFHKKPVVDVFITNMFAVATNLSNTREVVTNLPAGIVITGKSLGGGDLKYQMRLNPMAKNPTFDLNAEMREVDLTALNDFLRAYAKIDVSKGTLNVFTEMAAVDGKFDGYVKPLVKDIKIVDLTEDKNPLKVFWEATVAFFVHVFKNYPEDQFGTKVPFSGSFDNPKVGVWETVGGVLKNAFVKALPDQVEGTVNAATAATKGGDAKKTEKKKPDKSQPEPSDKLLPPKLK